MKLGQLTFVDVNSVGDLEVLNKIKSNVQNLGSPGFQVFADSLQLSAQTANASTVTFKPSDIFDSETYANTYLVQILAIGAQAGGGDTATVSIGLTDGATNHILLKPTNVTASGPLSFEPTAPLYINELNYLSINNSASVDSTITVYCGIAARGGAQ